MQDNSSEEVQQNPEDSDSSEGVSVPEEFQKQVHSLVKGAPKAHLNHMRDKISERESEIRKDELKRGGKKGANAMEYSLEGGPSMS